MEREQNQPPDPKDLVDIRAVIGWTLLGLSFVKKRKWLLIGMTVLFGAISIAALRVLPKTYESELTIHAKKTQYLSPERTVGRLNEDADVILHRREAIADMIKQTNLLEEYKKRRPALYRLKDDLYAWAVGPMSDKDLFVVLEYQLSDNLLVTTEGDTITINVNWRDPEIAYELALAAQDAFLKERQVQEISMLAEALAILEKHSSKLESEIGDASASARSLVEKKNEQYNAEQTKKTEDAQKKQGPATVAWSPAVDEPAQANPSDVLELAELEKDIQTQQQSLNSLSNSSQQALSEIQTKLAQARAMYKEAHPVIADLKQQAEIAQQESPTISKLRNDLESLEARRDALAGKTPGGSAKSMRRVRGSLKANILHDLEEVEEFSIDDPEVDYARQKISLAMRKYERLQLDVDSARLDLETAQAAFRHRYRVVTPAEIPNKATKPKPAMVIGGALLGGLALGILIALALELRRGLIHEAWQVETALGLPVVAHIESFPEPKHLK